MLKAKLKSFRPKIEPRRIITVGGTLFCALGIGYLMQSTAPVASTQEQAVEVPEVDVSALPVTEEPALEISQIKLTSAIPLPPIVVPQPAALPDQPVVLAALTIDEPIAEMPLEEPVPTLSCFPSASASPDAAAMVTLTVAAPCMINERFTIHHNGMMFTEVTDAEGKAVLSVPALSQQAVFIVSFANGDGAVASAEVTSLEYYDRAVVQWSGQSGLQIHAFEYGSDYDEQGHVWADDTGSAATAVRGEGGFLTRHGASDLEDALLAEVYTFPTGSAARNGDVRLSVEAEVTPANCGRDIEAQSIQITKDRGLKVQDVVLAIPDCNAVGDFLVLTSLLNDLKIARN